MSPPTRRARAGRAGRPSLAVLCVGLVAVAATATACDTVDRSSSRATLDCAAVGEREGRSFYDRGRPLEDARDDSGDWTTADPADVGLDPAAVAAAGDWLAEQRGLRSLVVLRHGKLAYERYFRDGAREQSNNVHSASKSILQAVTGAAVAQGRIASLDTPLSTYLPQYAPAGSASGAITVGELLTMSSGLRWREDETEERIEAAEDWVGAILALPRRPDAGFGYSTGNTHVLSAVIAAATGMSTCAYAEQVLFAPLRIAPERWVQDPQGVYAGGYNMYLTARELAKFGQLYLADGAWGGNQVVPEATVAQSRAITATEVRQPGFQYSSGWWTTEVAGHPVQLAWGFGGQYVAVVRDLDLVVTTTQNTQGDGDRAEYRELDIRQFLAAYVVPAVR